MAGCGDDPGGLPTRSAAAFIDSIGVNVHLSYTDTPYANVEAVRARLRELGIRHVRDGLVMGRPDQYRALKLLARDRVRTELILGDPAGRFGTGTLVEQLATLEHDVMPAVSAVEGPNEYDLSGDGQWARRVRDYQAAMVAGLDARPPLADLPVVGPSVGRQSSRSLLGDLSGALDLGNFHPYPGGEPPESGIDAEMRAAQVNSGSRPLVATETGYHDAVGSADDHPPVSEQAAAAYVPRLFLSYFRAGVRRTFAYELVDERADPLRTDLQANFGLLREDLTPKPSFVALRNLVAAVKPAGKPSESRPPRLRMTGQTADVEELLLDQGAGRFALVLWAPDRVWDPSARTDLAPEVHRVSVELPRPSGVALIRPARSASPEWRVERPEAVDVAVPPDPVVLRIRP
jgi:hypothetical protein